MEIKGKLEDYEHTNAQYTSRGYLNNKGKVVELVTDEKDHQYARKIFPSESEQEEKLYFQREISLLYMAMKHGQPFVRLVEYKYPTQKEDGYIITEFMKAGNLLRFIGQQYDRTEDDMYSTSNELSLDSNNTISASSSTVFENPTIVFDSTRKQIIIYGLAKSIQILHMNGIYHRDIKPENVLLDENGCPYLSDFGLARRCFDSSSLFKSGDKGTTPYMAPEIYYNSDIDIRADIFSFGATVLLLLAGELKMKEKNTTFDAYSVDPNKLRENIKKGNQYIIPDDKGIPQCYKDLIAKCLKSNPDERAKIDDIVNDLETLQISFADVNKDEFENYKKKINPGKDT